MHMVVLIGTSYIKVSDDQVVARLRGCVVYINNRDPRLDEWD